MDPLQNTVDPFSLPRITSVEPQHESGRRQLYNHHKVSPFAFREDINQKIVLWTGDITLLGIGAIVNPTSESFSDKNPISDAIHLAAGPELRLTLKTEVRNCRTGDAKITPGFKLAARQIIHTVGPRYNVKYKTAADSTLYGCYRGVMQLLKEHNLRSVAIPCVHTLKRGYPIEEGGHIAIRTVRRFLEKYSDEVDLVVFVVAGEYPVYRDLLPLYFPRSQQEEEFAAKALPEDVGNSDGEPVIVERKIRIDAMPHVKDVENLPDPPLENTKNAESVPEPNPFLKMAPDQDEERKERVKTQLMSGQQDRSHRYDNLKKRARREDIKDLADVNCMYRAGLDTLGREIVVFVGKNYPAAKVPENQALAFFITNMDSVVNKPYILIYFNTETQVENVYDSAFYKLLYDSLDQRYLNNLRGLYLVHTNLMLKASLWWFLTFSASEIKYKVHQLQGVHYLYDFLYPQQLTLPPFIMDYDVKVNGTDYYHARYASSGGTEDTGAL